MGWDGAGNYTRSRNFSADASAKIKILASAMDEEFDDFASAIGLAWLRDGQNTPTADIPMGGFTLTNVGGASSASQYIRAADVIGNVPIFMEDAATSADNVSVSASFFTTASAGAAPANGTGILVKLASDKSSAPALHINTGDGSPHSANIVLQNGSALYSGAMTSGGIYDLVFSSAGSVWQLQNPTVWVATTTQPGIVALATTAEVIAGTNTTKAVTPATLSQQQSAAVATTASAGIIELATTAEVTAGTDAARAVTPAGVHVLVSTEIQTLSADMRSAVNQNIPYKMIMFVSSASVSIIARSDKASAWTLSTVTQGQYRVNAPNLTTAHYVPLLTLYRVDSTNLGHNFTLIATASMRFQLFDALSVSAYPASAYAYLQIERVSA